MEVHEVKGNEVVIYCGGRGVSCENRCIEDLLKQKFPGLKVVFR